MKTYISLVRFTQKALQEIKGSPKRVEAFKKKAKAAGASVKDIYWTNGAYDGVVIFKAKNAAAATALMLSLNSKGFVKTETLRAFDRSEFESVLSKVS